MTRAEQLDELYESLFQINSRIGGDRVCLVLAANGCGRLEDEHEGWLLSWNTLYDGVQCMRQLSYHLQDGRTYEDYVASLSESTT